MTKNEMFPFELQNFFHPIGSIAFLTPDASRPVDDKRVRAWQNLAGNLKSLRKAVADKNISPHKGLEPLTLGLKVPRSTN